MGGLEAQEQPLGSRHPPVQVGPGFFPGNGALGRALNFYGALGCNLGVAVKPLPDQPLGYPHRAGELFLREFVFF